MLSPWRTSYNTAYALKVFSLAGRLSRSPLCTYLQPALFITSPTPESQKARTKGHWQLRDRDWGIFSAHPLASTLILSRLPQGHTRKQLEHGDRRPRPCSGGWGSKEVSGCRPDTKTQRWSPCPQNRKKACPTVTSLTYCFLLQPSTLDTKSSSICLLHRQAEFSCVLPLSATVNRASSTSSGGLAGSVVHPQTQSFWACGNLRLWEWRRGMGRGGILGGRRGCCILLPPIGKTDLCDKP